jgi:ankyrin repeat protein
MRFKSFVRLGSAFLLVAVSCSAAAAADAPLADAMEKMDRAAVRALLQRHADVNAPQVDGMTALHWAAYQDDVESVELLLRAGATVKAANRYGITPLTLAITNGDSAMVEALLKAGADSEHHAARR